MKKPAKIAASVCILFAAGCATHGQVEDVESTAQTSQRILRENETRLSNLENSISALNTQLAQLNNRVYEVRTKSGQRTSMTVVPINPSTPSSASTSSTVTGSKSASQPAGKKIDPAARPSPLVAQTPAKAPTRVTSPPKTVTPAVSNPATAGPSGQLAALPPEEELAMPPVEAAAAEVPVPTGNTYSGNTISAHAQNQITPTDETVVPVPLIPASDLSLPPENTALNLPPQTAESAQVAPTVPQPSAQPARTVATTAQKGEEAAYQQALKAARSGHTAEGIRLFRDFLQKYPNGKYTANADYWIGECLYAQGKYQDALSQFQNINSSFPKHHKNADALLKAGMSFTKIGDNASAQQKYRQLLAEFPNSEAAKRVRAMGIK